MAEKTTVVAFRASPEEELIIHAVHQDMMEEGRIPRGTSLAKFMHDVVLNGTLQEVAELGGIDVLIEHEEQRMNQKRADQTALSAAILANPPASMQPRR